ncbi:rhodanese-like domain-containing protein, partial [Kaarinaea lacus]
MQQLIDFAANNIVLVSAFFIILFLLIRSYIVPAGAKSVTPMEAVRLINHKNALLLDVRTQEEFAKSHILNAVNIPMGLLESRVSEIQNRKSDPVILVCQSGSRSMQSARTLKKNAFNQLYNLSGGMLSWQQANLPVESMGKDKSAKEKGAQKKRAKKSGNKKSSNISRSNIDVGPKSETETLDQETSKESEKIIVY